MRRAREHWNERSGTVSRAFDEWKLTERNIRRFLVLTLELSRSYFDQVWNRIVHSPAGDDGEEMVELFDREVKISSLDYEWMALSATLKDAMTAFEVYVEAARAEVFQAHGVPTGPRTSTSWKLDLQPFLTKTLEVPIPRSVGDVIRLRQILTHARGELRTEDDRRKYAAGVLWGFAELTEGAVGHALDGLAVFIRELDPDVWAYSWGGERLKSLKSPVIEE